MDRAQSARLNNRQFDNSDRLSFLEWWILGQVHDGEYAVGCHRWNQAVLRYSAGRGDRKGIDWAGSGYLTACWMRRSGSVSSAASLDRLWSRTSFVWFTRNFQVFIHFSCPIFHNFQCHNCPSDDSLVSSKLLALAAIKMETLRHSYLFWLFYLLFISMLKSSIFSVALRLVIWVRRFANVSPASDR